MIPSEPAPSDDPAALQAMLAAERVENERLRKIIRELQRHRFGRRAESLPLDQLQLGLEEAEQAEAADEAVAEATAASLRAVRVAKRRANRGALPAHLPRIETVVDIADDSCPCCSGPLHRIGEDVSERLDVVPAQFRVLVMRRPKYACRACTDGVAQAPAPARLIEGGLPTDATVAQVLVSKFADHLPLYRQAQIFARQGVNLDRSTLADWVGRAALLLEPVHGRLLDHLKASTKLFADETTAPVLDPGRGRTKTGQLWAYARDDRPWGGADPPAVAYVYAPDRKAERPMAHLAGFTGVLQVDGYEGYRALTKGDRVKLAFCWAHVRRGFIDLAAKGASPIAAEVLTAHRGAVPDRGRDCRVVGGGASPGATGAEPAAVDGARALPARQAGPPQPEEHARRGDPLRDLALGRADALRGRRPGGDGLQHSGALDPPPRQAAQRSLRPVVRHAHAPVVEEAGEGRPAVEHVVHRPSHLGAAGQAGPLVAHPALQGRHERGGALAACRQSLGRGTAVHLALDGEQLVHAPHRFERQGRDHRHASSAPVGAPRPRCRPARRTFAARGPSTRPR